MPGETSLAALAFRLRETTEGTPEREALLERIAAEIREGRYEVDADSLADKLLHSTLFVPKPDNNQK
ncbi:MAG: flagellar biosynthesis anti-sigma factor FlgM [Bryobacteraceae bacterium]|nr:flagellar biosynthesis anti-sigma factor FlgM [Bryobacteraceae bacterium]